MRKLFCILLIFYAHVLAAQSVIPGRADDINTIKLQQDKYIFAEVTDKSDNVAVENVKHLLEDQVAYWASLNVGKEVPKVGDARIIILRRGPYFRAFAYVETDNTKMSTPKSTIEEESKTNELIEKPEVILQGQVTGNPLSEIHSFEQIKPFINTLDEKGLLIDYGKFMTQPETGSCFFIIYNRNSAVVAKLRRDNKELRNVDTGHIDSFSNYPGCGAIWFRTFNDKLD